MNVQLLEDLARQRIVRKAAEDDAIAARREIDAQIADLLRRADKPEGAVSEKAGPLGVTATFTMNRKVKDKGALEEAWPTLPAAVQDAFTWKPEVSDGKFKKLSDADKAVAAQYIETKPGSTSIEVKEKTQ